MPRRLFLGEQWLVTTEKSPISEFQYWGVYAILDRLEVLITTKPRMSHEGIAHRSNLGPFCGTFEILR